jgi:hypothetical protein
MIMSTPPPHRDAPLLSLAFCLGVGALVRFGLLQGHDLRGAFGPDAPGSAASAMFDTLAHPYPLHPLAIRALSLIAGDPVQAALLLSLAAGLAAVAAAWAFGRLLTDGRDGRSTALLAATAPLLVQGSLLRGGDALALAVVAWAVVAGWWGALASTRETPPARWRAAMVAAGLLWGLSAACKPIALPAGALLLATPWLCGRRGIPWLLGGLLLGGLVGWPFLGPLLRPQAVMGLLGSWWVTGVPKLGELPAWILGGGARLLATMRAETWAQLAPLAVLAILGCVVAAPRRPFRLAVLVSTSAAVLVVAAMLGDRLQARYLAAASLGWVLLAGVALTPPSLRRGASGSGSWRSFLLGPLPLSLVVTAFVMGNLRFWDGLALLRAQEEGSARASGFFADWAEDWRPLEAYAESSVCGALELEELARELVATAPRGSVVVTLPLRDGRAWHLLGPLRADRPDLTVLELGPECCPHSPSHCAARLPLALATAGGGSLVVPLEPEGRCESRALPHGLEGWAEAMVPLCEKLGFWYGVLEVTAAGGAAHGGLCEALGGRAPAPPARP